MDRNPRGVGFTANLRKGQTSAIHQLSGLDTNGLGKMQVGLSLENGGYSTLCVHIGLKLVIRGPGTKGCEDTVKRCMMSTSLSNTFVPESNLLKVLGQTGGETHIYASKTENILEVDVLERLQPRGWHVTCEGTT